MAEEIRATEAKADEQQPKKVNGAEVNELVFPLSKTVIAHGDEVNELKFREPTAADIEVCGSPVMLDFIVPGEKPKMTYEIKAMFAMMSRLAAVPPSTIRSMNTKDWELAALALAHRFLFLRGRGQADL